MTTIEQLLEEKITEIKAMLKEHIADKKKFENIVKYDNEIIEKCERKLGELVLAKVRLKKGEI